MEVIRGFTSTNAAALGGVNQTTLIYWDNSGFLKPSVKPSGGTRYSPRLYSFTDVVAIRAVRRLRQQRVPLQRCRKVLEMLQGLDFIHTEGNPLASAVLLVRRGDVQTVDDRDNVISLLSQPGQYALPPAVIDLAAEVKQVRRGAQWLEEAAFYMQADTQ